jgi:hypothetical protein
VSRTLSGDTRTGRERAADRPTAQEEWRGEMVHLSWKPRAFLYKKFLSDEECEHIKDLVGGASEAARCQCAPQRAAAG